MPRMILSFIVDCICGSPSDRCLSSCTRRAKRQGLSRGIAYVVLVKFFRTQMFEKLGLRPARLNALLAALAETGGGLLFAAGFLTPAASAAIIAAMTVAALGVHLQSGFFAHKGGWEYTFVLAGSALGVALAGPGALSLDAALGLSWGEPWGVAALIVGFVAGLAVAMMARSSAQRHAPSAGKQPQA